MGAVKWQTSRMTYQVRLRRNPATWHRAAMTWSLPTSWKRRSMLADREADIVRCRDMSASCRYCCKSRRGVTVEFKFETIESGRAADLSLLAEPTRAAIVPWLVVFFIGVASSSCEGICSAALFTQQHIELGRELQPTCVPPPSALLQVDVDRHRRPSSLPR